MDWRRKCHQAICDPRSPVRRASFLATPGPMPRFANVLRVAGIISPSHGDDHSVQSETRPDPRPGCSWAVHRCRPGGPRYWNAAPCLSVHLPGHYEQLPSPWPRNRGSTLAEPSKERQRLQRRRSKRPLAVAWSCPFKVTGVRNSGHMDRSSRLQRHGSVNSPDHMPRFSARAFSSAVT